MRRIPIQRILPWFGVLALSCTRQVRPDDMSVQAHVQKAQRASRAAQAEMDKAKADSPEVALAGSYIVPDAYLDRGGASDPMSNHLSRARRFDAKAQQHEYAAYELKHFQDTECRAVPAKERPVCPMLGSVEAVTDVRGGVRVSFLDGRQASAVLSRMRCHYAYARARGFEDKASCPLDVRGLQFRSTSDSRAIEIVTPDARSVAGIRKLVRSQLPAS